MTNQEFDVLDELYFLCSFGELAEKSALEKEELKYILESLLQKGWINCYKDKEEAVAFTPEDFETAYDQYFYLATKAGLFAHNSSN